MDALWHTLLIRHSVRLQRKPEPNLLHLLPTWDTT